MTNRPNRYKRIITGGSIHGYGIDTTLAPTDELECLRLINFIDGKDVFTAPINQEDGEQAIQSVKDVRTMASNTRSLVDSEEAMTEIVNIETACRKFMRDYKSTDDILVLDVALDALRASVGESTAFIIRIFNLRPNVNFDVSPYEQRGIDILNGWLS